MISVPRPGLLRLIGLFLLAFAVVPAGSVFAQSDDNDDTDAAAAEQDEDSKELDDVVVTGTMTRYSALKSDTPIMETARSVSVETAREIRDKGALELADTYLYSAGVFGETYGFATRGDWVKVRGLDVPEYRDSLQALFSNYNNTRPHVYTLEQVEILKGPASVLYGQGSPGGLVNVVSKTPRADLVPEVFVQYGSHDHKQIGVDFGGALNEDASLMYRVTAVGRDSDTMVDFINNDTVVVAPSITWSPTDVTDITLLGNFQDTDSKAGAQFVPVQGTLMAAPNGRFIDDATFMGEPEFDRYNTQTESITLLASHMFSPVWSIEVTGRYTGGEADYRQAWPSFIGGSRYVFNDDGSLYNGGEVPRTFYVSDATSEQKAVDTRIHADFSHGVVAHEVMMGVQYQDVTTENDSASAFALGYDFATGGPDDVLGDQFWINLFDPGYGNVPSDDLLDAFFSDGPEANTRDLGLYVNDQISVGNWRITGGLRYDDVTTDNGTTEQDDDAFSFSVGALYRFDNGLAPYVNYAESFEPVVGVDNVTHEPLKPREGRQYEAGIKYQPRGVPAQITLAAFDIEQSNLPNPNDLPDAPSQQEGVAEIRGVEVEARARLGDFTLEANASHIETEDANGFEFPSVPSEQASMWLGYEPPGAWHGFRAGVGVRYVGESWDGADSLRTPSYTLGDLMIGYRLGHWDFALNARNITDREYLATCLARGDCFFGERRTVVGTVRYRF